MLSNQAKSKEYCIFKEFYFAISSFSLLIMSLIILLKCIDKNKLQSPRSSNQT